jgi:hypothetical protein
MTKRPVFSREALPTRPMGLRDLLLWWLVADKVGIDLWVTSAVGALLLLRFLGELVWVGQEDQCLNVRARSQDESSS